MKLPTSFSFPPPSSRIRWVIPLALFVGLAALTCIYSKHRRLALEEERNLNFQRGAAQVTYELRERLQFHAQFLRTVSAYFASSEDISAEEWSRYAARTDAYRHLPGMVGYGYAPRIARDALPRAMAQIHRRDGDASFRIFPETEGRTLFPVVYLAAGSEVVMRARGFDLYSEAVRREGIDFATRVDDVVVSGRTILVHDRDGNREPGFLLFRPVYRPGAPIANVGERQAALLGVVFAAYRMPEFLETTAKTLVEDMVLRVFDTGNEAEPTPFHDTRPKFGWKNALLTTEHELSFGYRTWRLEFALPNADGDAITEPTLILAGGLTISLLLATGVFLLLIQRHWAMAYAAQATRNLRNAEAEIRAREQFKQAILDGATEVSVIATDPEGTITLFNRGAERMLGIPASEMLAKASPARIHLPEEIEQRSAELSGILKRPVTGFDVFIALPKLFGFERREWTYRRADGGHLRVDLTVTALKDAEGAISGYLGIAIDVSEKRAAEEKLARQHEMVQTILANVPCGISLIDAQLNFIAANSQLLDVLDFPRELFAERTPTFREVALFNARRGEYGPGDPEALADALMAKAANPQPHQFERTRPNGRVIEVRGTPLRGGGFVTIYMDITERKRIEEELRRHRDNLQEMVSARTADLSRALAAATRAHQAKSEFLANMSHELRTPMHAIMSFSRLGMDRVNAGPEKIGLYFERIRTSAERLVVLINDLLDLSKFEAGRMPLDHGLFDLRGLVESAISELESLLPEHALTVDLRVDSDETRLRGDAVQIARVVHNLLANAIKFSRDGGTIVVSIADSRDLRGDRALELAISDSGIGIPEDELDHVFEKFAQSSATKNGAGGTGLGLAISREIILAHHGTIAARNNPNGGATFTVTLPLAPPSDGKGEPVI